MIANVHNSRSVVCRQSYLFPPNPSIAWPNTQTHTHTHGIRLAYAKILYQLIGGRDTNYLSLIDIIMCDYAHIVLCKDVECNFLRHVHSGLFTVTDGTMYTHILYPRAHTRCKWIGAHKQHLVVYERHYYKYDISHVVPLVRNNFSSTFLQPNREKLLWTFPPNIRTISFSCSLFEVKPFTVNYRLSLEIKKWTILTYRRRLKNLSRLK